MQSTKADSLIDANFESFSKMTSSSDKHPPNASGPMYLTVFEIVTFFSELHPRNVFSSIRSMVCGSLISVNLVHFIKQCSGIRIEGFANKRSTISILFPCAAR